MQLMLHGGHRLQHTHGRQGCRPCRHEATKPGAPHLLLRPPQLIQCLLLLLQHLNLAAQPLGLQASDEKALCDLIAFNLHAHEGRGEEGTYACIRCTPPCEQLARALP